MKTPGLVLLAMFLFEASGCAGSGSRSAPSSADPAPIVRLQTTAGDIIVALDRSRAPLSVDNFLMYADRGAYDGTIFHRTIPSFVIQGGGFELGPDGTLVERAKRDAAGGRPDKPIRNEWRNGLKNVRGTIAMARDADPDTATREFYFNVLDNPKLDSARPTTGDAGYAVFGWVIDGMPVIDQIKNGPTRSIPELDMQDVPVDPVVIRSVRRVRPESAK
ncbi:MAG: peptidylprolyl isomerase [Phycisphaerales bacterium]